MSQQDRTIGISFMPDIKLERVPVSGSVQPGLYYAASLNQVEVISQDPKTGRVTFEIDIPDTNGKYVATLDGEVFKLIFHRSPSGVLGSQG
jgi:hypothetical protein